MPIQTTWRARNFGELIGNEDVVTSVKAALKSSDPNHAILITGPSGTGKTTLARIIAMRLGAYDPDSLSNSGFREINAGDMRGIDAVRAIGAEASRMPLGGGNRVFFVDECFYKDTLVSTPTGSIPIRCIKEGDSIVGAFGSDTVEHVFVNKVPLDRVVCVAFAGKLVYCTKDHKFFTTRGWVAACLLTKDDQLIDMEDSNASIEMCSMWEGLRAPVQKEVLLQELLCEFRGPWEQGKYQIRDGQEKNQSDTSCFESDGCRKGKSAGLQQKNDKQQPVQKSRDNVKNNGNKTKKWNTRLHQAQSRRERPSNNSANTTSIAVDPSIRNRSGDKHSQSSECALGVQSGFSVQENQTGNRDRREGASFSICESQRQKENGNAFFVRVDSVAFYERGDTDGFEWCIISDQDKDRGYVEFYDLQVKNHPSYTANGVLVHNCHRMTPDAQEMWLKILEEAAGYNWFIFATTNPETLKTTFLRRPAKYEMKPLPDGAIVKYLTDICDEEGIDATEDVLQAIVSDCMGSMGIAMGILDAIKGLSAEQMLQAAQIQAAKQNAVIELCRVLVDKKCTWAAIRPILANLKEQGEDAEGIRRMVLGYCSSILLKKDEPRMFIIMDAFHEPMYNIGFPGVVFACYAASKG